MLIFLIFWPSKFVSAQPVLSPPFPVISAASHPVDVVTPPHRVTLPSHGAKTSLLPLLHLSTMIHLIISPLKSKLKH
jgi:hypothetical protein